MDWLNTLFKGASNFGQGVLNRAQNPVEGATPLANTSAENIWKNLGQGTNSQAGGNPAVPGTALVGLLQGDTVNRSTPTSPTLVQSSNTNQGTNITDPVAAAAAQAAADARRQNERDLSLQQGYLQQADNTFRSTNDSILSRLGQILGGYQADTARNEADFTTQSRTNQDNYNLGLQQALLNASRGRQGLLGTLASLGALSGTGIKLADRAVQQGANLDIAGANNTFSENQIGLNRAIEDYRQQDAERRSEAENQAGALRNQAQNDYLRNQQEIFIRMGNLYNALGNQSMADDYFRQANTLSSQIGATAGSTPSAISPVAVNYTSPTLSNYTGGQSDVSVAQGQPNLQGLIPSLLATIRRREQQGV